MVIKLGTSFKTPTGKGTSDQLKAKVGEEYEPIEITVTEEMVERNAWANDDYNPWYMENSPWGGRIASPTLIARLSHRAVLAHYAAVPGGGFHAKQEYEFINPMKIGKTARATGKLVDRYSKRGRDWFVHEFLIVDEDGVQIMRTRYIDAYPLVARPEK